MDKDSFRNRINYLYAHFLNSINDTVDRNRKKQAFIGNFYLLNSININLSAIFITIFCSKYEGILRRLGRVNITLDYGSIELSNYSISTATPPYQKIDDPEDINVIKINIDYIIKDFDGDNIIDGIITIIYDENYEGIIEFDCVSESLIINDNSVIVDNFIDIEDDDQIFKYLEMNERLSNIFTDIMDATKNIESIITRDVFIFENKSNTK
jgi:hypothetical protein